MISEFEGEMLGLSPLAVKIFNDFERAKTQMDLKDRIAEQGAILGGTLHEQLRLAYLDEIAKLQPISGCSGLCQYLTAAERP